VTYILFVTIVDFEQEGTPAMDIFVSFFFSTVVYLIFFCSVAKIMTGNFQFKRKEFLYILIVTLLTASIRAFVLLVPLPNLTATIFSGATFLILVLLHGPAIVLYYFKIQSYNMKTTLILALNITTIVILTDAFVDIIFTNWFPDMRLTTAMVSVLNHPIQVFIQMVFHLTFSFVLALLFSIYITPKLLAPNINSKTQKFFFIGSLAICTLASIAITTFYSMEYTFADEDWSWNIVFVVSVMYFILFGILSHTRLSEIRHESALKEEALLSLQRYMADLEQQQLAIRKFKHDFQNILLPMQELISNEQWDDLKRYFSSEIMTSSEILRKNEFTLAALNKIHIPEIKSMLAAKLIWAQSLNINTTFEADQDIRQVSLDSVTLVRMLGIILDNAIEELTAQECGALRVGCFKAEHGVTFIIQNTCSSNTPPLHEILKTGFSTKGKGRGLGLQILSSLADSHENIFLTTSLFENTFTQKLFIEDADLAQTNGGETL